MRLKVRGVICCSVGCPQPKVALISLEMRWGQRTLQHKVQFCPILALLITPGCLGQGQVCFLFPGTIGPFRWFCRTDPEAPLYRASYDMIPNIPLLSKYLELLNLQH